MRRHFEHESLAVEPNFARPVEEVFVVQQFLVLEQ